MAAPLQYLLKTLMAVALEKSLLVIHKILRLLVNTLTADASIIGLIETIWRNQFTFNYLKNKEFL